MRLIRWGERGRERPGLLDAGGRRRDASALAVDWNEDFFRDGSLNGVDVEALPLVPEGERWGACVARPSKLICVGLNYREHARETGKTPPEEPLIFFKATTALNGPYDEVRLPRDSQKSDWEVELAVVMGRDGVAGYCLMVDYSERAWQYDRGGQWVKGKSFDTFAPLGPWMLTADEAPEHFDLSLRVNGETRQKARSSDMIFPVERVIAHLRECMTLLPGDIISTGTPSGVAQGMAVPRFLQPGDVVEAAIDRLGAQRQEVVTGQGRLRRG